MYLSELKLWNFRKYGIQGDTFESSQPGVSISFHKGVNVLIGENDAGKTAIVDAIRYTLRTQSGEYIQLDEKDFHQDIEGNRTSELMIECVFDDLNEKDSGLFWEWLNVISDTNPNFQLHVRLYAKRKDNVIISTFTAGPFGATEQMDSEAKNLLRVVYLKPLRDAVTDMTHGYKSRFAQILSSHSIFSTQKDENGNAVKHELEKQYKELKKNIDGYFKDENAGTVITKGINSFLTKHFLIDGDSRKAEVKLTGGELSEILRQLDLVLEGNKSGLGTLNLLCIAAEMLLLSNQQQGLKLAIIEELEAHLHPQYQLRLIDYIVNNETEEQFILTTHSITLASKIKLSNLIILKNSEIYPMSPEYTQMLSGDYHFLERFLDATKSNLFFAKGLIIVEGDAENLLIPTIANILGCPLHKAGVSIVNAGNTAYKRYLSIFKRKDGKNMDTHISVVTDLDIRSIEYYEDEEKDKTPCLWRKNELLPKFNEITSDVYYDEFPPFIQSKAELKELVKCNRKESFSMTLTEALPKFAALLTEENKVSYDRPLIASLRTEKATKLHQEIDCGAIKIFLPHAWTLEYEIASSRLYRYLCLAIILARIEKNHPESIISDESIEAKWNGIISTYPLDHSVSEQESYNIFKPLNDGDVSKAITAQYLAAILNGDIPPTKGNVELHGEIKTILESDDRLSYIKDAIVHATSNH